jgi:hypothetical protein
MAATKTYEVEVTLAPLNVRIFEILCGKISLKEPGQLSGYSGRLRGWTARVRFPTGTRDFSLFHSAQTDSGVHPSSYTMGTGGSFLRGKAAGP